MKLFLDTANVEHIKEANEMGVICGEVISEDAAGVIKDE